MLHQSQQYLACSFILYESNLNVVSRLSHSRWYHTQGGVQEPANKEILPVGKELPEPKARNRCSTRVRRTSFPCSSYLRATLVWCHTQDGITSQTFSFRLRQFNGTADSVIGRWRKRLIRANDSKQTTHSRKRLIRANDTFAQMIHSRKRLIRANDSLAQTTHSRKRLIGANDSFAQTTHSRKRLNECSASVND